MKLIRQQVSFGIFLRAKTGLKGLLTGSKIEDTSFRSLCSRPKKWSLLHAALLLYINTIFDDFKLHRRDMLYLVATEYEAVLLYNDVLFTKLSPYPEEMDTEYEIVMLPYIEYLRKQIPVTAIVQSTFQLLFGDRNFLFHFNKVAALSIKNLKQKDHPDICSKDGILKRVGIPDWLKKGVFYRDKGRCALCTKDLTGVIATAESLHYDHIYPLAEGGSNDPTNFQLLCEICNLEKRAKIMTPSDIYPVYWKID